METMTLDFTAIAALDRLAVLHGSRTAAMIEALKNV